MSDEMDEASSNAFNLWFDENVWDEDHRVVFNTVWDAAVNWAGDKVDE